MSYSADDASGEPSRGGGGWFVSAILVVFVWVGLSAAAYYFLSGPTPPRNDAPPVAKGPADPASPPLALPPAAAAGRTTIGVAYGTEKERWLKAAAEAFAQTEAGRSIAVELYPMGSLEGAHAVLKGDERLHVWCPAASMYRDVFLLEWKIDHVGEPILKEEVLALSPMVFVFWKERSDAFLKKYGAVSFRTVGEALAAEGGWGGVANEPEWGLFKFGHAHPNQSNSGLSALVLAAYDFHDRSTRLTRGDVVRPDFQKWLSTFERGVSGLGKSTGSQMREMVLKGPSSYDALLVYENVAIDYLKNAEGRWGSLRISYPKRNLWNDNPYYILNTKWTTPAHHKAAEAFLAFLMSEPMQRQSMEHGFRPGNPAVAIKTPDSPFVKFAPYGVQIDVPEICETPPPEVLDELLAYWQRAVGR